MTQAFFEGCCRIFNERGKDGLCKQFVAALPERLRDRQLVSDALETVLFECNRSEKAMAELMERGVWWPADDGERRIYPQKECPPYPMIPHICLTCADNHDALDQKERLEFDPSFTRKCFLCGVPSCFQAPPLLYCPADSDAERCFVMALSSYHIAMESGGGGGSGSSGSGDCVRCGEKGIQKIGLFNYCSPHCLACCVGVSPTYSPYATWKEEGECYLKRYHNSGVITKLFQALAEEKNAGEVTEEDIKHAGSSGIGRQSVFS